MRVFFSLFIIISFVLTSFAQSKKSNFIIIFADDLGYGDLSCFGSKTNHTPNLDKMAKEGLKLTNFLVASSICSPSRAALLTGCYPKRVDMHKGVLFPHANVGLHPDEVTIADMLKNQGYSTACMGKWHVGDNVDVLPTKQGFDYYYGIPYSNDMSHKGKKRKGNIASLDELWKNQNESYKDWNTPLVEGEKIIELPVDQRTITQRYTDKTIHFIEENREHPFFIYLPHSMPHIPLYTPKGVQDKNPKNAYKNVIEHLDNEIGRVFKTLKKLDLEHNTYVIFTSDNGPWIRFKHHGGSAGVLRGGKMTTFEGGFRVPCIVWNPNRIKANTVSNEVTSTIDLLPTLAKLANANLPKRKIDGKDISGLWLGENTKSPHDFFMYYTTRGNVEGIRKGDWKLKNDKKDVFLFNLKNDIGEQNDLAKQYPKKVEELTKLMLELDKEITENSRSKWRSDKH